MSRYDVRYQVGMIVKAEKNDVEIIGTIIEVKAEMTYEIELANGSRRSVDHCHILEAHWD